MYSDITLFQHNPHNIFNPLFSPPHSKILRMLCEIHMIFRCTNFRPRRVVSHRIMNVKKSELLEKCESSESS
ncbi:hypothetical protein QTP88_008461 [Uroleucon formosanum]